MKLIYVLFSLALALALIVVAWPPKVDGDRGTSSQEFSNVQASGAPPLDPLDNDVPTASTDANLPDGVTSAPAQEETIAEPERVVAAAQHSGILANRRLVTYYGNPFDGRMGILGELDQPTLIARLRRAAALYEAAGSARPMQPALHLIVTVAQEDAGRDGMYRLRMPESMIEEYSHLAAANDMLLILDVQVGRSTVQAELEPLRPYLERPHVHLALDPEFDMWADQQPGIELGHMTAEEINYASALLAGIVASKGLPDKVLIVHQFTDRMLPDKQLIQTRPGVELAVVMDGFGGRGIKLKHYEWYVKDELIQYAGIKMFFRQDIDMFAPEEILALDPVPDVIVYQ